MILKEVYSFSCEWCSLECAVSIFAAREMLYICMQLKCVYMHA